MTDSAFTIDDATGWPRVLLGSWPTLVEPAPRLATAIGLGAGDLWIKRDDLSGLGGGGNKIRKLEWTVGAALAAGADTLVTTGAPQSNHARLTAAVGARLGLDVVLVFPGRSGDSRSGNLVLDGLFGARIAWAGGHPAGLGEVIEAVTTRLRADGARPVVIPLGGSNATGAHGYRLAAAEIRTQVHGPDHVVVALGSGGSMAGLVAGLGADHVLGVDVGAVEDPRATVAGILADMPGVMVDPTSLRIQTGEIGAGYGTVTEHAADALTLAARTEGVVLDPIYTARALSGLRAAVVTGDIRPGQTTVFLHTGGLPGLFGYPDAVTFGESSVRDFPLT